MNKFKMGTGENDQKKRKTSVSGKESKKPKLEKNLVKTQEVSGASSQKNQLPHPFGLTKSQSQKNS